MAGAGYKLFNTGDVLTAAQVNTYLNEQTVMVFASSAARTSALSGVLAEGMMSYLQDTNAVEVYNGTAWVGVGNVGDITEVQAGVGISVASGTGPIPVITNSSTDLITTAGDILYGTAADTVARLGIGTAGQVLKVNSGATAPEWGAASGAASFVGCSLKDSNITQSIANGTNTALTWDTEDFDTDGFHSTSSNTSRITIPSGKGGKYLFIGATMYAANATGVRIAKLFKNGSELIQSEFNKGDGTNFTAININAILDLVATDYVEFVTLQNSGGSLNAYKNVGPPAYGWFACQYLGA
jgi:hypothetical protein